MNANEQLIRYYESYDEDSRLDSRHGTVEFLTTMRYIERCLTPDARILDVGAGTGRYSHALAGNGYRVDAVELVRYNIDVFQQHTQPDEPVTIIEGNALDLSAFQDETYDIVLLLGPMYHLCTQEEQHRALSEAVRVTKHGGSILAAYCMDDAALLYYGFREGHFQEIADSCAMDVNAFDGYHKPWGLFKLCRTEEIDVLREGLPVTLAHRFAAEGYASHMREALSAMNDAMFERYLQYHMATCERPGLLEISNHVVDVYKKN